MKYVDEFRDSAVAKIIADKINAAVDPTRHYHFMEFCGGHTHAISRYGVIDLLPKNIRMIHGPGCPVCVLPIGRIDMAIRLAREQAAIMCVYADTLRVPASDNLSLLRAKALGADIRMIGNAAYALELAQKNPDRQVIFFAIGFETTTPPTALVVKSAQRLQLKNFSVLCAHVLTPPAIAHILNLPLESGTVNLDGFIGPSHVSVIIGLSAYSQFVEKYRKPVVIGGFEPLDVMQAIYQLVLQVNEGRVEIENEFSRGVTFAGNVVAQNLMNEVFEVRDSFEWRGLGEMPHSALKLRAAFAQFDAEERFNVPYQTVPDHKKCECGSILRGAKTPQDCTLFGTVCTPESPMGSCMVSSEGACSAHYTYGRFRDITVVTA